MEGQNKRTEVQVECSECGDVFPVAVTLGLGPDPDSGLCPECLEE